MDFGSALLLTSTVFLIVELASRVVPQITAREKVIVAIIAGQITALLVAHSPWGEKQVVNGIAMSTMNWGGLVLVGLALAGLATVGKQVLNTVSNVGENKGDL